MKIAVWFLSFLLLVEDLFCNDDLLSKFHQNGYKLKDMRVQLISYDENFYNFFEIKAFKYNRTTTAQNMTLNFKVTIGDKLEVLVQGYKFLSNEYRHFPIRYQVNFKKSVEANALGLIKMNKCGNITTCYFYKDITYHSCNFVVDETRFPPLVPNGKYKWEVQFLYLNQNISLAYFFHEIYTPVDYPKK